ncbi:Defensin-like protein 10 [Cardamine amara subsp. amara]|uniref:Defensin-like protein 10 n=1 Tax=Cardamine amara subsp. amara TaxID=228776 RepID=A0ABD1BV72_CARAN
MKLSLRLISALLLSFMLLFATGMGPVEAKTCESPSSKFKGVCLNSASCAKVCPTEGASGGRCNSLRCICSKTC